MLALWLAFVLQRSDEIDQLLEQRRGYIAEHRRQAARHLGFELQVSTLHTEPSCVFDAAMRKRETPHRSGVRVVTCALCCSASSTPARRLTIVADGVAIARNLLASRVTGSCDLPDPDNPPMINTMLGSGWTCDRTVVGLGRWISTALLAMALGTGCDFRTPRVPNDRAAASVSGRCDGRLVSGEAVGPIRLGMALDPLRRACPVVRDTTMPSAWWPADRRLSVLLGADTAVVTLHFGRVYEILLTSGAFHTADSIGIGTPLRVLLARPLVEGYGVAGQLLVATPTECGLTFGIAGHYPDLPDGAKDSAIVARVPPTALVDRIRIDGCEQDEEAQVSAIDDSTYDVQTDSVILARDLDGNGLTDYVVHESRPVGMRVYSNRLVVYLDSIPSSRRAQWSSGWDLEGETTLGEALSLGSGGSLLAVFGNTGDYTSETLLAVREGSITEELTHGEDYGAGFLELTKERGALVVDASQWRRREARRAMSML